MIETGCDKMMNLFYLLQHFPSTQSASPEIYSNAIKLLIYVLDTLTMDCRRPEFVVGDGTTCEGNNLHVLYAVTYAPWKRQPELKKEEERLGIRCLDTELL